MPVHDPGTVAAFNAMLAGGGKPQRREKAVHFADPAPADERDRAPGGCMQPPERVLEFAFHHYARGGGGKREQRAVDIEEESPVWLRPGQDRRFGTISLCWPN